MPVLLIVGELDTKYVDIAQRMADADPAGAGRGDLRAPGTRATSSSPTRSLTCSPRLLVAREQVAVGHDRAHGEHAVDRRQRRARHVTGQHPERRQAARVRQLRERGRERDPGRDPDRRLHHRAHHRRDARGFGDRERGAHATERLLLQHDRRRRRRARAGGGRRRWCGCTRRPRSARRPGDGPREVVERARPAARRTRGRNERDARSSRPRCRRPTRRWRRRAARRSGPTASRTALTSATPAASRTFTLTAG